MDWNPGECLWAPVDSQVDTGWQLRYKAVELLPEVDREIFNHDLIRPHKTKN